MIVLFILIALNIILIPYFGFGAFLVWPVYVGMSVVAYNIGWAITLPLVLGFLVLTYGLGEAEERGWIQAPKSTNK